MGTITLKNFGGVDLTIRDREFVVVTGTPGSGSAIVRSIAGLGQTPVGEIFLDEQRIDNMAPKDRDVALLSHDYIPYPAMSVYQNLAVGLQLRKFGSTEIQKRVANVAEMLGLRDRLETRPESLSAAERRFVGLARVLVRQAKVSLFDEPFANLDRTAALRGRAAIAELHARASSTVIYATSDPAEALAFGARTVVLQSGSVQQDADAETILETPANLFVAGFFGDQSWNLVEGTVKQDREGLTFSESGDGTIALPLVGTRFGEASQLAGRPVVLGIPPHALELADPGEKGGRLEPGFRALVERTELRGLETDLYVTTGAHKLVCRSRRWRGQDDHGHRVQIGVQLEKAQLFDPVSGHRLTVN